MFGALLNVFHFPTWWHAVLWALMFINNKAQLSATNTNFSLLNSVAVAAMSYKALTHLQQQHLKWSNIFGRRRSVTLCSFEPFRFSFWCCLPLLFRHWLFFILFCYFLLQLTALSRSRWWSFVFSWVVFAFCSRVVVFFPCVQSRFVTFSSKNVVQSCLVLSYRELMCSVCFIY